jgi:coatomer subunit beta'
MDTSGKIIWARHNDIQTATIQGGSESGATSDGDRVQLAVKDLGNCEVFPQSLQHSPNGRFAVVCGDGEYIIYTALSWRNKSFGTALEFVWAQDSNEYAVREGPGRVNTFKAFKERHSIRNLNGVESIFGGALLACCSGSTIFFYDWATGTMIRRIDAKPTNVSSLSLFISCLVTL